ncbi:uncharacterized protein K452DRAFT_318023 [Aplosporella prunicola CBS 121167]|uniref:Holocytochrome c-type synthase n=1 Tax=Aplosporella prunicola CBS 121167 TaxID=1176127 RepID=A0A6A6BE61_9PEZI|nr:uncharacterized protein K452DRAFT_318023 [Aplosporella prunicola CBS 121167]KAF2142366.1 hypothetical protein K452DRAFT_318023 [Aplosporella prunicola CBS 121167]
MGANLSIPAPADAAACPVDPKARAAWLAQQQQQQQAEDKCPVDHNSRAAWMEQAKAARAAEAEQQADDKCPVDHNSRAAWMEKAKAATAAQTATPPPSAQPMPSDGCDSSSMDQTLPSKTASAVSPIVSATGFRLGERREVSTIPRAFPESAASGGAPANNEQDTGADKGSGNWIYPSEQMFFNAMRRKNFDPRMEDMRSIVPIHNAVNERAWKEIKEWEEGRGSEECGGPKLVAFAGQSTKLTPRARLNTFLGYQAPFDRHDWTIDRCGVTVDYVIDFYAGRDEGKAGKSLNFYLDVRPKLNSWEAVKTRASRFVGM